MTAHHGTESSELTQQVLLDDPGFLQRLVERTLQQVLETEMTAHLGAEPYERTEARTGHRNGYKPRTLTTRVGTLTLMVPQDREGTFSTALFARYQRSEKALVTALMEMYLEGVSTRKVKEITEALCGTSFSKSLVSSLTSQMDAELAAWRSRSLADQAYPYLSVDARYEDVRDDGRVTSLGVLIVAGVREDGHREILAVDVADTESEATYQELFRGLKARGLHGVELVTSDDHAGLRKAIARHFQGAGWQRCQVHFTRDVLGMVSMSRRGEIGAGLRTVFTAPTLEDARRHTATLLSTCPHPAVVRHIEEHIEECFAVFAFPPGHRTKLRSTNGLERFMQELKRRSRVIRIFPNRAACLRLMTALCAEQSEEWITSTRYLDITELRRWQRDHLPQEVTVQAG